MNHIHKYVCISFAIFNLAKALKPLEESDNVRVIKLSQDVHFILYFFFGNLHGASEFIGGALPSHKLPPGSASWQSALQPGMNWDALQQISPTCDEETLTSPSIFLHKSRAELLGEIRWPYASPRNTHQSILVHSRFPARTHPPNA